MLQAATEEADTSIQEAYAKGYHSAELILGPDVAYWKKKYEDTSAAEAGLREYAASLAPDQRWTYGWTGFGMGNVTGFALALFASWVYSQTGSH